MKLIYLNILLLICLHTAVNAQCPARPKASLRVENNDVCGDDPIRILNNSEPNGNDVFYVWDWGDRSKRDTVYDTSTPQHPYNLRSCTQPVGGEEFEVRLFAVNKNATCLNHESSTKVYVYKKPQPTIDAPNEVCLGNSRVNFKGNLCPSNVPNTTILWDFGDPNTTADTSSAPNPSYTYTSVGNFTVTLTVKTIICGNPSVVTKSVLVKEPAIANADFALTNNCAVTDITFNNTSIGDVTNKWTISPSSGWVFANNTNSNTRNPIIRFVQAGTYMVSLSISNPCGNKTWTSQPIVIKSKPMATLDSISPICETQSISPKLLNLNDGGSNITNYDWQFQNATPATSDIQSPGNIIYNNVGLYPITIVISNSCGTTNIQRWVRVLEKATAAFVSSGAPTNKCGPFEVSFKNNSTGASSNQWSIIPATGWRFGSNSTAISKDVSIRFEQAGQYVVRLDVKNPCGDKFLTENIEVITAPKITMDSIAPTCPPTDIAVNIKVDDGGNPLSIQRVESSGGMPKRFESFNNIKIRFDSAGIYQIKTTATNTCETVEAIRTVRITKPAQVAVVASTTPPNNCGAFTVNFKNNSVGATSQKWSVSRLNGTGGFTLTNPNPLDADVIFAENGEYKVTLEIGNACGAPQTWTSDIIKVFTKPVLKIADLVKRDCRPVTLQPRLAVQNGGGYPLSIRWIFEQGMPNASTDINPANITFDTAGRWLIKAISENICGSTLDSVYIEVDARQSPNFTVPKDTFCTADSPIILTPSPTNGVLTINGSVAVGNVLNPNLYKNAVKIKYTIGSGRCADSIQKTVWIFGSSVSAGADLAICDTASGAITLTGATPLGGEWSGRGVSNTGIFKPMEAGLGVHELTYSYQETVSKCINIATRKITVDARPKAVIDSLDFGCKDLDYAFTGNKSVGATTYQWSFGDSGTSDLPNPTHTYKRSGIFDVQLIIGSTAACRDTTKQKVIISEPSLARFSLSPTEGCSGLSVSPKNINPDVNTQYLWHFGNGLTSTLTQPNNVNYSNNNITDTVYSITLQAQTKGCPNAGDTAHVKIFAKTKADFLPRQDSVCHNQLVDFSNTSKKVQSYFWDYGNGVNSRDSIALPQRFGSDSLPRTYTIKLIVRGRCNADTLSRLIYVKAARLKAFVNLSDSIQCAGTAVIFRNGSTTGTSVIYRFDDGTTATGDSINHTFLQIGKRKITALVTNGCDVDSVNRYVNILETPSVSFTYEQDLCKKNRFVFQNKTKNSNTFTWQFGYQGATSNEVNPTHTFPLAGNYKIYLRAIHPATGCLSQDSAFIKAETPFELKGLRYTAPLCYGTEGSIVVPSDSVLGGTPPFRYSLNDTLFKSTSGVFSNLQGQKYYTLYIKDFNSCLDSERVYLGGLVPFAVDAGDDFKINLGDSVRVQATTNRLGYMRYKWQNTEGVACDTCALTWLKPLRNTTFVVAAKDTLGCEARDQLVVEVNRTGHIFVPNVFSPNRDGVNDYVFPFTDLSVKKIISFKIFDRWGGLVFSKDDFAPNVETNGWDGMIKGQEALPSVYTWVLEVSFWDDFIELKKGDVTLMR
jgi:gliding motility-associated-like protein